MKLLKVLTAHATILSLSFSQAYAMSRECSHGQQAFVAIQKSQYEVTLQSTDPLFASHKGKTLFDIKKEHDKELAKYMALKGLKTMNEAFKDDMKSFLDDETPEMSEEEQKKYDAIMSNDKLEGIEGGVYGFESHYGAGALEGNPDFAEFLEEENKEGNSSLKPPRTLYDLESNIRDYNLSLDDDKANQADQEAFKSQGLNHFYRGYLAKSDDESLKDLKSYAGLYAYLNTPDDKLPPMLKGEGKFASKFNELKSISSANKAEDINFGDAELKTKLFNAQKSLQDKANGPFTRYREKLKEALPINQRHRVRKFSGGIKALDRAVKTGKNISVMQGYLKQAKEALGITTDFSNATNLGDAVVAEIENKCQNTVSEFYTSLEKRIDDTKNDFDKAAEGEDGDIARRGAVAHIKNSVLAPSLNELDPKLKVCLYMKDKDPKAQAIKDKIAAMNSKISDPSKKIDLSSVGGAGGSIVFGSDNSNVSSNLKGFINLTKVAASNDPAKYRAELEAYEKTLTKDLPSALVEKVSNLDAKSVAALEELKEANSTLKTQFSAYSSCLRAKVYGSTENCRGKLEPSGHAALKKFRELQNDALKGLEIDPEIVGKFDASLLKSDTVSAVQGGLDLYTTHFNPNRIELVESQGVADAFKGKMEEALKQMKTKLKFGIQGNANAEDLMEKGIGWGGGTDAELQTKMGQMAQYLCQELGSDLKDPKDPEKKMSCDFATTLFGSNGQLNPDKLEDFRALMLAGDGDLKEKTAAAFDKQKQKLDKLRNTMAKLQSQDDYKDLERMKRLAGNRIQNKCDKSKGQYSCQKRDADDLPVFQLMGAAGKILGEIDPKRLLEKKDAKELMENCYNLYNKTKNSSLEQLCAAMRRGEVAPSAADRRAIAQAQREQAQIEETRRINRLINKDAYQNEKGEMEVSDAGDYDYIGKGLLDAMPYALGTISTSMLPAYMTAEAAGASVFGINQRIDMFNSFNANNGFFFPPVGFQGPLFSGLPNYSLSAGGGGGFSFI